jgi:hypothetical protein
VLTPARRRGIELLDDPAVDAELASRSLLDIARANRLFGGRRAVLQELALVLQRISTPPRVSRAFEASEASGAADGSHASRASSASGTAPIVLLDVGTGLGDIPRAARDFAQRKGIALQTIGLELTPHLARAAQPGAGRTVCADAMALPFATNSVDIVTCSQVLHHFDGAEAAALLRELTRVARQAVIISDLRRSWLAVGLLWLVSFPLRFHPVSRHDGIVSILRGYTAADLHQIVQAAVGQPAIVRHRMGWRVTALWSAR